MEKGSNPSLLGAQRQTGRGCDLVHSRVSEVQVLEVEWGRREMKKNTWEKRQGCPKVLGVDSKDGLEPPLCSSLTEGLWASFSFLV